MFKNRTLNFILQQVRKYWKETLLGTFLLILTNAIGVFIPIKIKDTIDSFVANNLKVSSALWWSLLLIIVLALLMAAIRIFSRVVLFGIGRRVESDQRQAFYNHLLGMDLAYFSTQKTGDLISRSTSDIQAIRQMMGFGLLNIINTVWVYALTLPLMIKLNAQLTFWILIGYVPILYFVKFLSNSLKIRQQRFQEDLGKLSSFIEEGLNGIQVIKSYSQEKREIKRFKEINQEYLGTSVKLARSQGLINPIFDLARGISFFALLYFANLGILTAGTVAAFLVCLERIAFPTAIMGWLITIFQRGSVSIKRIDDIFKDSPQINDASDANDLLIRKGHIQIQDLSFGYKEENILHNLDLEIEGGKFIGIVGSIGSGKSTICQALLRLIDIPPKTVFIDSQDIFQIKIQSLREQISLVPQETFLFNTTIQENIGFAGHFSQEEIEEASKIAMIHDEIENFPENSQTIVGEKGVSLSGGQAQRIALARAIITKPKILILDDSIASVDNEIGLKILGSVRKKFSGQTLILVTHRVSTLKDADQIYVIDQGKCVGQGKHSNLLRNNSIYQKLWKQQKLYATEASDEESKAN